MVERSPHYPQVESSVPAHAHSKGRENISQTNHYDLRGICIIKCLKMPMTNVLTLPSVFVKVP
jgi:hypothetical protein